MFVVSLEQQLNHTRDCLARITLALCFYVEGHTEFGLTTLVKEVNGHITDQFPVSLAFSSDLEPGIIGIKGQLLLFRKEGQRIVKGKRGPALVAGYLGMVAVGGEADKVFELEGAQH
eukprot:scaffold2028_cov181-Ochromonas_danica.AAC.36